ncbi:MAG: hypothetical protein A3G75_12855 [Verrucomicrobia bacterium RIFCSPLOWO2_12_FULL_64_8]|nr:MAG: hypothetical protein A3G75_12855 [Verrucomicrobia bacterium RIFCSPLOWO2_12_FULL_64_8]
MARLTRILLCTGVAAGLLSAPGRLSAQAGSGSVPFELASLREDVRLLGQKVGDLTLRIEQLERENRDLQTRNTQSYVTLAQLNQAIAEVHRTLQAAQNENKREILAQVNGMLEKLAARTNAAIEALAKGMATRAPVAAPTFSGDFPRQGVDYTVQKGDTLSSIAQRMGSSVRDITNANKIADPNNLQVGQTIFVPQGGK